MNEFHKYNKTVEFEQRALTQFRQLFAFLKQHPTLSISLVYLLVSFMGLFYVNMLLNRFEVDILSHLEVSDLMLAIFHYPTIFVVCALCVVGFISIFKVDKFMRKYAWYRGINDAMNKPIFGFNPLTIYVFGFFAALYIVLAISADMVERDLRSGKLPHFTLVLSDTVTFGKQEVIQFERVQVVADSAKYLWIFLSKTEQVLAIPQKNVGILTPAEPKLAKEATVKEQ